MENAVGNNDCSGRSQILMTCVLAVVVGNESPEIARIVFRIALFSYNVGWH